MDGDFISTDIRYRDGPINVKSKSKPKRKNAASYFVPKECNKGAVVDGACGGGAMVGGGVLDGVDIDVIGGDDHGNLYVGGGESVVVIGADGVSGTLDNTGTNGCGGIIGDEDVFVPAHIDTNRGEKEKYSVIGGESVAGCRDDALLANTSGGNTGEEMLLGGIDTDCSVGGDIGDTNVQIEGGANFISGEESSVGANVHNGEESGGVGANVHSGEESGGVGANVNSGEESGGVSVSGGGAHASVGRNVGHIPLIPRRRLREILAHAQGECMVLLSVFIVCK